MTELVILDMDGLLIDSEPFWQETERKVFGEFGITITPEMQHATFGLRTDEQIHYWYSKFPWKNPDFKKTEQIYNENVKKFFTTEAVLMEGAEYIIDFFTRRNIPIALASSSTMDLIETFTRHFRLREKFVLLHSAEYEEYGKPHPAVYISTAKKMNVPAHHCLAFEDSLHGVVSARAAKMKVVAVPDKHNFNLPGYAIADYKLPGLKDFSEEHFHKINSLSE